MNRLDKILDYFPAGVKAAFEMLEPAVVERINEIRLRKNGCVLLIIRNTAYFLDYNGDLYDKPSTHCVTVGGADFDEIFMAMCAYSLYSHMDSLKNGYLTLPCGARVGVAASGVYEEGALLSVKDVTSLNIRVPSQIVGCAEPVLNCLYVHAFPSIIIAGKPNSGKTTLLRDLARGLSGGFNGSYRKVTIVDERYEFSGKCGGDMMMDVGVNCDVLAGFRKAQGIELATRTLSPEMILCDEIATRQELESILYAFSSGISFALSVHIGSREDLLHRPIVRELLKTGEFSYIVLLEEHTYQPLMMEANEVYGEICRNSRTDSVGNGNRLAFVTDG